MLTTTKKRNPRLGLAQDYDVALLEDRPTALKQVSEHKPEVVLLDGLPPRPAETGGRIGGAVGRDGLVKVIIMSPCEGEKANALQAIGSGAYDFLAKPVDLEVLKLLLKRAFHVASLEREFRQIQQLQGETFAGMSYHMSRSFFNSI